MLLSVGIPPALSKIPIRNLTVKEITHAGQLVQQGRVDYEEGRFHQAEQFLQAAARVFEARGEQLQQAITLSNLSLTYQQLGKLHLAEQAVHDSLKLLQEGNTGEAATRLKVLAQTRDIQGRLYLAQGRPEDALDSWQQAATTYKQLGDRTGIASSQINQAQALQALGLYQRAKNSLTELRQDLQQQPDSLIKAKGLRSLGDVLRATGDLKLSQDALQESLIVARHLNLSQEIGAVLLSLGNTDRAMGNRERDRQETISEQSSIPWICGNKAIQDESTKKFYQEAGIAYQQAISQLPSPTTKVQAQLNHLSLLLETEQWSVAQGLIPQIQLAQLPKSRTAVYAQINLAKSMACLQQHISTSSWQKIDNLLEIAVRDAKELKDKRAESYALGHRGAFYEYLNWWQEQSQQKSQARGEWIQKAQQLTQQALLLAQPTEAPDIAYQWQWQLGRLLEGQGNIEGAITNYTAAVKTLDSVRKDLLVVNSDVQFSFRDNVEPIYRELVSLLLQSGETEPPQKNLQRSLYFMESLQLAELENFLQCNLQTARSVRIDQSIDQDKPIAALVERINQVVKDDPTAALFYPIILKDRVAVILKLPGEGKLRYHATGIGENAVKSKLKQLKENLKKAYFLEEDKTPLQDAYNWLIKPFETDLEQSGVKTLAFVLDGSLRDIPMAALHDGQQYLVQKKYDLALAPSVQLLELKRFERGNLKTLIAGVTKERRDLGFAALPLVENQIELVKKFLNDYEILLNEEFTKKALQNKIESSSYTAIHLATHGRFSSNLQETFILTADDAINLYELEDSLKARDQSSLGAIQLLVLSACQTAAGDKRAILGIAGVAVKSGAHSTIAPLWLADEQSTTLLMGKFYEELVINKKSQAEALHLAQKSFLEADSKYPEPRHWASFVLVGDWL